MLRILIPCSVSIKNLFSQCLHKCGYVTRVANGTEMSHVVFYSGDLSFFFVAEQHYMAWGLGKGVPSGVGKFGAQRQSLSVADPVHERRNLWIYLCVVWVFISTFLHHIYS